MENNMKCEKCGGVMEKMDETTMKCAGCGVTKNIGENNEEIVEEEEVK